MSWQFTVGLRVQGKADRIVVDAEDALVAALKVKAERPDVAIMYVRRLNRRGDTRHPPNITRKKPAPPDADAFVNVPDKFAKYFSANPGEGD
jgi:hypothetical protein